MPESNELSDREREILTLVTKGASNKQIAHNLHISTNTVKVHLRNIFIKINANSRTEAAMYAVNAGIVDVGGNGKNAAIPAEGTRSSRILIIALGVVGFVFLLVVIGVLAVNSVFDGGSENANQPPDPAAQRWQERAPLSEARKGLALVNYGGEIFAIGGESTGGITNSVEKYDPNLDQWTNQSAKPISVTDISAVAIGGKIYVPGGRTTTGHVTNVLDIYSPIDDTWEQGADLPSGLSAYAMVSHEGYLYLFGGWDGRQAVDTVFQYDPNSDSWLTLSPMPTARAYPGVSIVEGNIYVIGGFDGDQALTSNEIYHPDLEFGDSSPWEVGEPLPNPRYAMGVASLADTIYVIGGKSEPGDNLSYLELPPNSNDWNNFSDTFESDWSHIGITSVGTHLYLTGGELDGKITDQNLAFQAVYLISLPVIR
jgi:DNA-binding CsgD family transcriptional regulator/N-acetylneuraminic acid mutarotase